jgi:ferric-dicitrate binding protein FerR (iron transport regulator)
MKSFFGHSAPRSILLLLLGAATVVALPAAQRKEGRVSQVMRDVNLLAPHAAARPAHLNDSVTEGSAIRTGVDAHAELIFSDFTITRVGGNSIFSFEENGRNVKVENGAILLRVPTDSGGARIRSSALTVAITGTTAMFEHHRRTYTKLIVLEGSSEAWLTKYPGKRVRVRGGQMLSVKAGATHLPEPVDIDLDRLLRTAILITEFRPLPSLDQIRNVANGQKKSGAPLINALIDPTGMGARDVNASTRAQSTPSKPPGKNRNP